MLNDVFDKSAVVALNDAGLEEMERELGLLVLDAVGKVDIFEEIQV